MRVRMVPTVGVACSSATVRMIVSDVTALVDVPHAGRHQRRTGDDKPRNDDPQ